MGRCKRRGYCCQDVRLAESPDILERAYMFWKRSSSVDPDFSEIYLIYPMLEFKHEKTEEDLPYHYRCKHFVHDTDGIPTCSIYEIRNSPPSSCLAISSTA